MNINVRQFPDDAAAGEKLSAAGWRLSPSARLSTGTCLPGPNHRRTPTEPRQPGDSQATRFPPPFGLRNSPQTPTSSAFKANDPESIDIPEPQMTATNVWKIR